MRIKMGTVVPKMGTFVHLIDKPIDYRKAMAMALHEELGSSQSRGFKMAMRWTGASERTVKYWLAGERGPSGRSSHRAGAALRCGAVHSLLALCGPPCGGGRRRLKARNPER